MKNLDDGIDDERLRKEFSPYGTITSAKVRDRGCRWGSRARLAGAFSPGKCIRIIILLRFPADGLLQAKCEGHATSTPCCPEELVDGVEWDLKATSFWVLHSCSVVWDRCVTDTNVNDPKATSLWGERGFPGSQAGVLPLGKPYKCQSCHQGWCQASLEGRAYGCRGLVWL